MGLKSHCEKRVSLGITRDGGFAELVAVPPDNVHLVLDSITDDEAVFVEPLAACVQLTKMSSVDPGSTWAVLGAGRLGLLLLQVLALHRPRILVAIGHAGAKLEMARRLGFETFAAQDAARALELTGGVKFDNVVEASGTPEGLSQAMGMVRPGGTLHLKSTHGLPVQFDATRVAVEEIRVQGSRCGPFDEAIELLDQRAVRVDQLITHRFPIEKCVKAFDAARSKSAIKTVFEF